MQTFGAQYVVYEDSGFLRESVHRVYPFLKKILFLVGFEPWNGKGDVKYPLQSIERIFSMPDPDKKFVVVQKYWATEEEQRNEGLKILHELGCDWGVVIDDDELYNRQEFYNTLNRISNWSHSNGHPSAFTVPQQIYWKNRDTVIAHISSSLPTFAFTTPGYVHFTKHRAYYVDIGVWNNLDQSEIVCHHMSYVRSDEQMLRKISTFSHADEIRNDWYQNKWLGWNTTVWNTTVTNLHPINPQDFHYAMNACFSSHILEAIPHELTFTPEKTLFDSYVDYRNSQLVDFKSHESENTVWSDGQKRFIDEFMHYPLDAQILDISCGDGIGLRQFRDKGFTKVEGFEWDTDKTERARQYGYRVHQGDMHDLHNFPPQSFDVVYSSHTLEHALKPKKVLQQFRHVLRADGDLVLVLPFPDTGPDKAHCGKYELGTDRDDGGQKLTQFLEELGFKVIEKRFDNFREPEIWLRCKPL
jgi:ubiquinone/menaquinone biosynthesis C-methylase UbiE